MNVIKLGVAGACLLPATVMAQGAVLPDTIERCRIIAQEMTDYNNDTRLVFERFCEMLHAEVPPPSAPAGPAASEPPDYFVKCVVAGDPVWIGFRLVTRQQCDEMQGTEMRSREVQAESASQPRDFSPK